MKKTIALMLSALLALTLAAVPTSVLADAEGSCGENITYFYDSTNKILTLTGEGAMTDYVQSSSGRSPFYQNATIRNNCTKIVIGEGITHVGNYIFFYLTKVTEVSMPSTLESIGSGAFQTCSLMASCTIPETVTSIGEAAFNACRALQSVDIPAGVEVLPKQAFNNCIALTEINVPGTVKTLGQSAFGGCTGAASITIGEGVETIGMTAFSSSQITEVTIPASVTSLSPDAFSGSYGFTAFHVDENNPNYSDVGGVLYDKDKTVALKCPTGFSGVHEIPEGCAEIADNAFEYCSLLTGAVIPGTVTRIGSNGFMGSGVTSIEIPSSVTELNPGGLQGCTSLVSAVISANVDTLPQYFINNCPALETVVLSPTIISFGASEFSYCTSLTSIDLPAGLTALPEDCFYGCSGLTSIEFPEGLTEIGMRAFQDCTGLTSVTLPEGLTVLGSGAFCHCTGLTEVTVPAGVTRLEGQLFNRCENLAEVWVLGEIEFVGGNAFGTCPALTAVHFSCTPMDPTAVGNGVFNNTPNAVIHYPNVYPDWETVRPFDKNGPYNSYTGVYEADQVGASVEFIRTEIRERAQEDDKQDLRFVYRLTPMEGVNVDRRYIEFSCEETGSTVSLRSLKNFAGDVDGTIIFTAVLTGLEESMFDYHFTARAYLVMSGAWEGTGYSLEHTATVNDVLNAD